MLLQNTPCTVLKGVGPQIAARLTKLGIASIQDLLFHLPSRYQDRAHIIPLGRLRPGMQVAVEGNIELTEEVYKGRRTLLCRISDGTGFLTLRFFHFNKFQKQNLKRGARLRCFGEVRFGYAGYEMIHPEYVKIDAQHAVPVETHLTAIYPTTEGLHQLSLRKLVAQALDYLTEDSVLTELLPSELLAQFDFPNLKQALLFLHKPPADVSPHFLETGKHVYQQRLIFEELLAHRLSLQHLRTNAKKHKALSFDLNHDLTKKFLKNLPFQLTQAQQRVIQELQQDLALPHPMMRLVQGDVGSGKTVVAAYAAALAVENKCQVAIMAPTEILAEQHLNHFKYWLEPLGVTVVWLTGQLKSKQRRETLEKIASGEAQVIIGTHALFQEQVVFHELGLVVIDEQHRFGVHQRLALREKGAKQGRYPHQLIMTATPIPRTLAMSVYADLDNSVIDELPPGRKPVVTIVVGNDRRAEVIERIRQACQEGRQVYWVCTLIEDSEVLQCQAVENAAKELKALLPEFNVALVHGRMKSADKENLMSTFKQGNYQILVATTVIEVGVDVPNASLMVIENPERFGLAQLHQLRGRIGRGNIQSHCVLMYQKPLSEMAKQRLAIMRETNDGFVIAQKDLELRGPGEVLGAKQTGMVAMKIANLMRDQALFSQVKNAATLIMQEYPKIIQPLIHRWIDQSEKYGNA